jgi:predicted ATP-dependent Lon-type protease
MQKWTIYRIELNRVHHRKTVCRPMYHLHMSDIRHIIHSVTHTNTDISVCYNILYGLILEGHVIVSANTLGEGIGYVM